jgi:hypothetical protein
MMGYRASKTFAEKAAWDFLEKEKPNFSVATINPPMVFGPIVSCEKACYMVTLVNSACRYTRSTVSTT